MWRVPLLILAAPTSVLLSRVAIGRWLRERGLLLTPEEQRLIPLVSTVAEPAPLNPTPLSAFEVAVIDPRLNRLHRAQARHRRTVEPDTLRQWAQRCLEQGPATLNRFQLNALARDADSLAWLHRQAWRATPDGYWGRRIGQLGVAVREA